MRFTYLTPLRLCAFLFTNCLINECCRRLHSFFLFSFSFTQEEEEEEEEEEQQQQQQQQ